MTRGQDSFTDAAESSTSLTPDLERHSIASASNRRYRPPVQYRESLFGSPQRSVISVAASTPSLDRSSLLPPPSLTPSSTRSASMVDDVTSQHSRTFDDDEHVSMAYRSPSRSISSRSKSSSYKRHVMDPKRRASSSFESVKRYTETLSRGRLEDEIHRLDQLQRRLDTIQQVVSLNMDVLVISLSFSLFSSHLNWPLSLEMQLMKSNPTSDLHHPLNHHLNKEGSCMTTVFLPHLDAGHHDDL